MKMKRKTVFNILLIMLMVLGTSFVSFGDIDYNQWNSSSKYPSDIAGTQLMTQARAFIDKGVITGDTDGLFHPERNITRAEFAAIMARATSNTGRMATAEKQNYFNDLKGYGWAKGYINACYEAGLMQGLGNKKFNAGGNVSYVEVVATILRSGGTTDATVNSYGKWPNNYIKYAEIYNMKGAIPFSNWRAPATKGNVVQLLYRNMPKANMTAATVTIKSEPANPTSASAITLSAIVQGSGTHKYQWYYNDSVISGQAEAIYSSGVSNASAGAFYLKVVTSQSGYNDATSLSNKIIVK